MTQSATSPARASRASGSAPGNLTAAAPQNLARVFLRPLATPLPRGFLALMVATSVFSALQLGWIGVSGTVSAAPVVLFFCVPALLLSCVIGFLCRDPVAGTGLGLTALGWGTIALGAASTHVPVPAPALSVILYAIAAALLVPVVTAFGKPVAGLVMALTCARFAVTATAGLASSYHWAGATTWSHAAGWVGIALGAVALYAAMAFELEGISHHTVLPVLRTGSGKLDDAHVDLDEQAPNLVREAGVRQQL